MNLKLITPAAEEPVSLEELKQHVKVDGSDEDADLTAKLLAARVHIENTTNRALVTSTWQAFYDCWPATEFKVPLGMTALTAFTYADTAGSHTVDVSLYEVDTVNGRIVLTNSAAWPNSTYALKKVNPIIVQFAAGWATGDVVPAPLRHSILLLAGHWYRNREAVTVGSRATSGGPESAPMISTPLAMAVDALTKPYVLWRF